MERKCLLESAAAPVGRGKPKPKRYEIREDSGASEIIEADSLNDALDQARDWAADGSYQERVMVTVWATPLDRKGNRISCEAVSEEVEAGPEPEEPECAEGEEHDWCSPHEVVGGIKENPGVWSLGGTSMSFLTVCRHCGWYRTVLDRGSQRNPGELEEETSYEEPNEASLEWVEEEAS